MFWQTQIAMFAAFLLTQQLPFQGQTCSAPPIPGTACPKFQASAPWQENLLKVCLHNIENNWINCEPEAPPAIFWSRYLSPVWVKSRLSESNLSKKGPPKCAYSRHIPFRDKSAYLIHCRMEEKNKRIIPSTPYLAKNNAFNYFIPWRKTLHFQRLLYFTME